MLLETTTGLKIPINESFKLVVIALKSSHVSLNYIVTGSLNYLNLLGEMSTSRFKVSSESYLLKCFVGSFDSFSFVLKRGFEDAGPCLMLFN